MVLEKVKAILAEQFDVEEDKITADTDLQEDLGADSLDVVDLLMSIEDEFEVEVPDEEIEISDYVHKLFNFVIDTCPEYIGGPEVDASNILLDIYNRLPPGTETARKKEFKSQIKALFRCKGAKRPRWIQEAEWPMGKNSPMVFVSQSHSADVYLYVFEDADTGEKRTITQLA